MDRDEIRFIEYFMELSYDNYNS